MVDWSLARQIARFAAGFEESPESGGRLAEQVAAAETEVTLYTGLQAVGETPAPELIDRATWAEINLDSLSRLLEPVARRLDRRLAGLAAGHGFSYTRYADDLTFSGDDLSTALRILDVAQRIIGDEGFAVNTGKTRLFRRSGKQVVTGLVVNDQVSTPRRLRRRLRAILHNAEQTGLDAQNRGGHANFRAYLAGLIGHIEAAQPRHAERLKDRLRRL